MRADAALILIGMGFTPIRDFEAIETAGDVAIIWYSAQPQPTEQQINDFAAANPNAYQDQLTTQARTLAQANLDGDHSALYKVLRAEALVLVDEINLLRQWIVSFKAQVASATTLADLKTRVAGLPNLPDRTGAQAVTAIKAKVSAGDAD